MIGIGKWQFNVNTMFLKGSAAIEIIDNNGKYEFNAEIPGVKDTTNYFINNIKENGNTLTVNGGSDLLPGKEITVVATFEDGVCNGYIEVPFLGKIPIKNGQKIG
ncbi:MAG: hypothetical protein RR911_03945 [Oscillospiraceae bacterium]